MSKCYTLSKRHKGVLIPAWGAGQVKAAIPHAIVVRQELFVPHRVTETRVLNNLGYDVPSPIRSQYHWPNGKGYTPFESQVETAAFLTRFRNGFVLNEIGTGKSLSALWAIDFMMAQGDISKVLIVSPLSTLQMVWGNELFLNFPHRSVRVLHGAGAKRKKLLSEDVDFYVINPDGNKVVSDELIERKDIDHIVIDECSEFRNSATDKYKVMQRIIKSGKTVWGMTGTPTPNAPTDAWGQVKLINPMMVPNYFGRFRNDTMLKISEFKWAPKHDALEKVRAVMQPSIRFTRDECYDLPECSSINLEVELTKEQRDAYKAMKDELFAEVLSGEVSAANEAVKMSKLIQIAAGIVIGNEGTIHELPCAPRLNELVSCIRNAGAKVIVFVPFKKMTAMVNREVSKHWTTAVVNGSVSKRARDEIFSAFQNSADPHVLVAHPKCMSHGLTLTEASTIIWYAPYPNNEVYTQSNGRITRSGQKNNQFIIHLQGSEIERRIYKRLKEKQSLQGTLLNMF